MFKYLPKPSLILMSVISSTKRRPESGFKYVVVCFLAFFVVYVYSRAVYAALVPSVVFAVISFLFFHPKKGVSLFREFFPHSI